jgi:hypothetical protein
MTATAFDTGPRRWQTLTMWQLTMQTAVMPVGSVPSALYVIILKTRVSFCMLQWSVMRGIEVEKPAVEKIRFLGQKQCLLGEGEAHTHHSVECPDGSTLECNPIGKPYRLQYRPRECIKC